MKRNTYAPGTTSAAYVQATADRINYFRAMAGCRNITLIRA